MSRTGRPSMGPRVSVLVRFPQDLLDRIDGAKIDGQRHAKILALIELGLDVDAEAIVTKARAQGRDDGVAICAEALTLAVQAAISKLKGADDG